MGGFLKAVRLFVLLLLLYMPATLFAQQGNVIINARYTGRVEYVMGSFGSFNTPRVNDSVDIQVTNDSLIVRFFPDRYIDGAGSKSGIHIPGGFLRVREEYMNILSPTEDKPTGNYNVRYSIGGSDNALNMNIQLVHSGDGKIASITVINITGSFVTDILIARLNKVK